ncbi:hypothetical protein GALMADRAFT_1139406 [Galerina marginata CBS 339.88]|uniref:Uncharacterized protein n=1 Tax=Galerina marginata (strain CBS 339.88) TaxID=685588 RepID=A0A067S7B3_GALM3|nr:hypothetical protein GALMADRAFT_1139406 [Galerina marginata CBS 339.88]
MSNSPMRSGKFGQPCVKGAEIIESFRQPSPDSYQVRQSKTKNQAHANASSYDAQETRKEYNGNKLSINLIRSDNEVIAYIRRSVLERFKTHTWNSKIISAITGYTFLL